MLSWPWRCCVCVQAGGCAGMCVDLTLFPLDTIKTRLQSQQGFYKAGGFRGIYAGVPSAAVGSFPNGEANFVAVGCNEGGSLLFNSDGSNEGEREQLSLCFVSNHYSLSLFSPCFLVLFLHPKSETDHQSTWITDLNSEKWPDSCTP